MAPKQQKAKKISRKRREKKLVERGVAGFPRQQKEHALRGSDGC